MATEKCSRCDAVATTDEAIAAGWVPYYWDEAADKEEGTLCPGCASALGIVLDEESTEHVLKAATATDIREIEYKRGLMGLSAKFRTANIRIVMVAPNEYAPEVNGERVGCVGSLSDAKVHAGMKLLDLFGKKDGAAAPDTKKEEVSMGKRFEVGQLFTYFRVGHWRELNVNNDLERQALVVVTQHPELADCEIVFCSDEEQILFLDHGKIVYEIGYEVAADL